ncbi:response regulator containing a CheY-like receiver domain and an HTH DNA-binding domain [Sanguibacter keddieii DSM 10542]|uniref:Response regulator containing a CheY-like receiver domain and an HTH DNA-binding domain n=1 Tax=Sanguibacter keddieii (strain ATCC 51767 / DSM 10542 / NCFB 3025 / ST-74) TaxID=446469 RepID=D1BGN7_SANKS|nr:response regulator transcription factor [Sanguibacter keddieii]ACZ21614.1 response regulator containing a CheY-like receiver domain and an HTH DNA-binding domain [Sanguibacter keddieii DSM 10542]
MTTHTGAPDQPSSAAEPGTAAPQNAADQPGTPRIRVLLVDDQELFRSGIAVIVDAQDGLEVVGQAADGSEAVRMVDDLSPDVVLMDVRMPELDGVEATRQIFAPARAASRAGPVRVIVLTTFDLDDRAAAAIRYGASGFLLKDATPAMLRDAIRTVHAGNAVLAPDDLSTLLDGRFRARRPSPPGLEDLTPKEREVLAAVAAGLNNAEIARRAFVSESTVKTHVGAVLRKLGLRDRVQVVVLAHEHGLVDPALGRESP